MGIKGHNTLCQAPSRAIRSWQKTALVFLCYTLSASLGCSAPCPECGKKKAGKGPIDSFQQYSNREYWIWAHSNMPLKQLVDLSIFGNFRPGMTVEQAKILIGPPRSTFQRDTHPIGTFFEFERGAFTIQLMTREVASEGVVTVRWRLGAVPLDGDCKEAIDPSIIDYLNDWSKEKRINVRLMGGKDSGMADLDVEDGRVVAIWWAVEGISEEAGEP